MDRRSFLKTSALGGTAAAATTLAAPTYAAGKRVLTMVQSWPRGFAALDDASSYYAKMIGDMSDGALIVDKKNPLVNWWVHWKCLTLYRQVKPICITQPTIILLVSIRAMPISPRFRLVALHKNLPTGIITVAVKSCMMSWVRFSILKVSLLVTPDRSQVVGFERKLNRQTTLTV